MSSGGRKDLGAPQHGGDVGVAVAAVTEGMDERQYLLSSASTFQESSACINLPSRSDPLSIRAPLLGQSR
jgi:hypothetical protein